MGPIATIMSGRTQPGKREELLRLFQEHLAPRAESNARQTTVAWLADREDDDAFHIFEIYSDPAAMEANSKADWFWAYVEKAAPLLNGQPEMRTAVPRWVKGAQIG